MSLVYIFNSSSSSYKEWDIGVLSIDARPSTRIYIIIMSLKEIGVKIKKASLILPTISTTKKQAILNDMADAIIANIDSIISSNQLDLNEGKKKGLSSAMIDRLRLNEDRILSMANSTSITVDSNFPADGSELGHCSRRKWARFLPSASHRIRCFSRDRSCWILLFLASGSKPS